MHRSQLIVTASSYLAQRQSKQQWQQLSVGSNALRSKHVKDKGICENKVYIAHSSRPAKLSQLSLACLGALRVRPDQSRRSIKTTTWFTCNSTCVYFGCAMPSKMQIPDTREIISLFIIRLGSAALLAGTSPTLGRLCLEYWLGRVCTRLDTPIRQFLVATRLSRRSLFAPKIFPRASRFSDAVIQSRSDDITRYNSWRFLSPAKLIG